MKLAQLENLVGDNDQLKFSGHCTKISASRMPQLTYQNQAYFREKYFKIFPKFPYSLFKIPLIYFLY